MMMLSHSRLAAMKKANSDIFQVALRMVKDAQQQRIDALRIREEDRKRAQGLCVELRKVRGTL